LLFSGSLLKKVKLFFGTELPLLDEKGYLIYLAAFSKDHLAASCKVSEEPSCKRKADDFKGGGEGEEIRKRTTFSHLCKVSAFLLQEGAPE
jgi:hypothetical protein